MTEDRSCMLNDEKVQDRAAWLSIERAEKVPERVARLILEDMVNRDLAVGDILPSETVMLEQLGVGRASLREALRILEMHGLVRIKSGPGGGPVIAAATTVDFGRMMTLFLFRSGATYRELLEARLAVEPVMARLAADRLTEQNANRLEEVLEEAEKAADAPSREWSITSEQFHSTIAAMSGNRVLDIFAGALIAMERRHLGPIYAPSDRGTTLKIHTRIANAILDHDGAEAERLTRRHVQENLQHMQDTYNNLLIERISWK
jgi:DNA-binding FadR family transcriptional regulator